MGREEQIEEREVLESIFPDEITDISETSYHVSIALDVPNQDDESESPSILLTVTYPETYPDTPPSLELSHTPSTPKPTHFTFPTDTPHLLSTLADPIADSLGQAMIFTLISALKDNAEALVVSRLNEMQAVVDREKAQAEEVENAKFYGDRVTREGFERWRVGFRAEVEVERERVRVEKEREEGKKGKGVEEGKMSGRMLFEKGLVGKGEEEDDGVDALGGVERLKVGS